MSIRGGKTRANKRPFSMRQTTGANSQTKDIRMLLMQQPGYRSILPDEQSLDDVADIATHPTGLGTIVFFLLAWVTNL
jgi:hypothetical protein